MRDNSAAYLKKTTSKIYVGLGLGFTGFITAIIFIKFLFSV